MPVTWIGIFDGLATITGVWLGNRVSLWCERRGRNLRDVTKLCLGMTGVALAWLFAAGIAGLSVTPLGLWLTFFVIQDFSYAAFIEPPVPSLVSRDSPPAVVSTMMSLYKASTAVSYFAAGWLVRFYEPLGPQKFFLLNAAVAGGAALWMIAGYRWWVNQLGPFEMRPGG